MPTMWDRLRPAPQKQSGSLPEDDDPWAGGKFGYNVSIQGGPAPKRPPRELLTLLQDSASAVQLPSQTATRTIYYDSAQRPPSSLYSQPSPTYPYHSANVASGQAPQYLHPSAALGDGISPPSSPEPDHNQRRRVRPSSADVSPIEAPDPWMSAQQGASRTGRRDPALDQQPSGNAQPRTTTIAQMRRARRKQSDAALREAQARERPGSSQQQEPNPNPSQDPVLWDPMTGERAIAGGRPSQVNPAEYAHGLGISDASTLPSQQKSPTLSSALGDRVRKMAQIAKPDGAAAGASSDDPAAGAFASNRPGWRGASGRSAIVEPVRDNRQVRPLRLPEKVAKRVASGASPTGPKFHISFGTPRRGETPPVSPAGRDTATGAGPRETIRPVVPSSSQMSPSASSPSDAARSYPSPPMSGSRMDQDAPSLAARQLRGSAPGPGYQVSQKSTEETPIRRKPPPSSRQDTTPPPPAPPAHDPNPSYLTPDDRWVQPASRFSVTTYATSTGTTPREPLDDVDSNGPPVPETPEQFREPSQPKQESVMDRKRPVGPRDEDSAGSNPIKISLNTPYMPSSYGQRHSSAALDRKAASTGPVDTISTTILAAATADRRLSTASSVNKSLPVAPPEATASEARDRVALLNAQLQSLGNRRINLLRSIKQMTELMPTDNLMASEEVIRKREMEKRKVESFRTELSEVQREEYEIGLKLHRAYKRLDRDADYEPTTLWVRRVAG